MVRTVFPKPLAEINEELLRLGQWEGELQHQKKNGEAIWVASAWVLQNASEATAAFVVEVNNDITGLKRADEALRYLAAIVNSSDDAIMAKDLNGIVTSWNAGAERIFGYSASEIVGKTVTGSALFEPE